MHLVTGNVIGGLENWAFSTPGNSKNPDVAFDSQINESKNFFYK